MTSMTPAADEPLYVISIAARMLNVQTHTLRYYERLGLISPSRTQGRIRLYSQADIERVRTIKQWVEDLGINLAGVEVMLRMRERVEALERENQVLREALARLTGRRSLPEATSPPGTGSARSRDRKAGG